MPQQRKRRRTVLRVLRKTFVIASVIIVLGVVLSGTAMAVVWGHFWDFQVDNATSDTCGNCHVMQPYVDSQENDEMLASFHASRGVTCVDCHTHIFDDQLDETISMLTGDYPDELETQDHLMDECFQCHEHGSYDQIAWRTTDLGVTDVRASGHSANPHQPPHFTNLECNNCHSIHQPQSLLCKECHAYEFKYP